MSGDTTAAASEASPVDLSVGFTDCAGEQHIASPGIDETPGDAVEAPNTVYLRPARLPRCIFISRIHPETTEDEIVNHISARTGAPRASIVCRKISSRRNSEGRSFTASFRVLVPEDSYQAALAPNIWPINTIVREFIPKTRSGPSTTTKNASARSPSTMPT